jgi:VanZ family protein
VAGPERAGWVREAARRWWPWLPVMGVMALIFVLSAQSGLRVSDDPVVDKPFRVSAHLGAFATLAGFSLVALSRDRRPRLREVLFALGLTALYALSDEYHQSFVPDRTGRLADVVIDLFGALFGITLASLVLVLVARRQRAAGRRSSSVE